MLRSSMEGRERGTGPLSIEDNKDADNVPKPHLHTRSILLLRQEAFHTKLDKHSRLLLLWTRRKAIV